MADNTKQCSKCKKVLPVTEFYLSCKSKDGKNKWYRSQCKRCSKQEIYNRQKERYAIDPEYRASINKTNTEFQSKKYQNDPEYRKRINKKQADWNKQKYQNDPEYKQNILNKQKAKWANDDEFREKNSMSKKKNMLMTPNLKRNIMR